MSLLRTADPHQQSISDHDLRLDYDTSRVLMGFVRNQSILSVNHLQVKPIGQKSISSGTKTPFWLFDVLVLSPPRRMVLVIVIESRQQRQTPFSTTNDSTFIEIKSQLVRIVAMLSTT